jgi:hypothetical protein
MECGQIRTLPPKIRPGQSEVALPQGKPRAEVQEKYFCSIKISTQMLISLWKLRDHAPLTSRLSTLFSSLHNLSARLFFSHGQEFEKNSWDGREISLGRCLTMNRGQSFSIFSLSH